MQCIKRRDIPNPLVVWQCHGCTCSISIMNTRDYQKEKREEIITEKELTKLNNKIVSETLISILFVNMACVSIDNCLIVFTYFKTDGGSQAESFSEVSPAVPEKLSSIYDVSSL